MNHPERIEQAPQAPVPPVSVVSGEPFEVRAVDGYPLRGFAWRHGPVPDPSIPVVIINSATSVRCRYYFRFAGYLFASGFDVIVYDYRGIGESRPPSLRGFKASWSDWGALDFETILGHAERAFPGQPVDVVAHSIGGCVTGLAASASRIRRMVTVGAQFAYWRDYAPSSRWQMLGKWHLLMPLLSRCCGYFPAKCLGWMEDTPLGVVHDWSSATPRFEERPSGRALVDRTGTLGLSRVTAPMLAISLTDDPFGTLPAIERLLDYYQASPRTHLRIAPEDVGDSGVGHFAFFHSRFRHSLWPLVPAWLDAGELPAAAPGYLASRRAPGD